MAAALLKKVRCLNCDMPTLFLASSLARIVDDRTGSSTSEPPLFFACPHCKLVGQAEISIQSDQAPIQAARQHPADTAPFGALLECAQKGCKAHIEVLGTARVGMDQSQARSLCRSWSKFGVEVMCENNHPPMLPPEIAGFAWWE